MKKVNETLKQLMKPKKLVRGSVGFVSLNDNGMEFNNNNSFNNTSRGQTTSISLINNQRRGTSLRS